MNGALLVNKPAGMTSAAVVGKIRRKFGLKKIGHSGTLDPMATGLLVLLVGKATRLQDMFLGATKAYEGVIELGRQTDTDDITGDVIREDSEWPLLNVMEVALRVQSIRESFTGKIAQVPPNYSAIHVGGKRSYALSRKGIPPELSPRTVEILELHLKVLTSTQVEYFVRCSKGTYVRSLARDLGEKLGTCGTLSSICRVESEPFLLTCATLLPELLDSVSLAPHLVPIEQLVGSLPRIELSCDECESVFLGKTEPLSKIHPIDSDVENAALFDGNNQFRGILGKQMHGGWAVKFLTSITS